MVAEMSDAYWFWRVSEGGQGEPYKSKGSVMPGYKDVLSIEDRWAVIAYQHAQSGHAGPHIASEHPEMEAGPRPHLRFIAGRQSDGEAGRDHRALAGRKRHRRIDRGAQVHAGGLRRFVGGQGEAFEMLQRGDSDGHG